MNSKFAKDLKQISDQGTGHYGINDKEEEEVEDELSNKRIKNLKTEFDLLNYCLSASLILFKDIWRVIKNIKPKLKLWDKP